MPKKPGKALKRKSRMPVGFICVCVLPALLLTLFFTIIPAVRAFYLSLTDSTALSLNPKFVGLENYAYLFTDKSFLQALGNTFKLLLVVPVITIAFALILAFMIHQSKLRERGLYRTVLYFPNLVSMTVVGIIWSFVFHPTMGILTSLMKKMDMSAYVLSWLGDSRTALWCVAVALIWQATGYYMIMHIAAMDGISAEIYEAATLDGATGFRKFISITVPLIKNIVGITFILAMSGTLVLSFTLSNVMTGGGPNGASTVLLGYMYNQSFVNGNFGYGMAIAVFSLAISIGLSVISRKISAAEEA